MNYFLDMAGIISQSTGAGLLAAGIIVGLLFIWSFVWKGIALWKSAGLRQKWWFVALLVINTLGILEIFYIFVIAPRYKVEVVEKTE